MLSGLNHLTLAVSQLAPSVALLSLLPAITSLVFPLLAIRPISRIRRGGGEK